MTNRSQLQKAIRITMSLVFIAGISSSCVSTNSSAISSADRAAMRGRTVAVTSRKMPSYGVLKQSAMAGAMLGGAVGGAIAGNLAEKEGAVELAKHHVANPNDTVTRGVSGTLVAKTGLNPVPSPQAPTSLDPNVLARENKHADYVLDCCTTGWMGTYYPFSMGKYFIMYGAKMQLVETSSGRVVAEGYNFYQGKDRDNAPDYDGIYSNDAAFLKSETKKGTDGAILKFNSQF